MVDLVTGVSMFLPFFKYYVWNVICVCVCVCVCAVLVRACVLSYFVMGEVCYERSKHDKQSLIDNCIVLVYSCCLVSLIFLCLSVATTTDLESGHSQQILHQPSNIDIVSWRHIERIRMLLSVKTSHMVVMEQNDLMDIHQEICCMRLRRRWVAWISHTSLSIDMLLQV